MPEACEIYIGEANKEEKLQVGDRMECKKCELYKLFISKVYMLYLGLAWINQ